MEIPHNKLFVKQIKELAEIFTGFETKNKYEILSDGERVFSYAFEDSSIASRLIVGGGGGLLKRPMKINIMDENRRIYATIQRPFGFFLSKMEILDEEGRLIASIKQKFGFLKKKMIINVIGSSPIQCVSKASHPWTFNFLQGNTEIARVSKKWSGGKELISDADNFVVDFMNLSDNTLKVIILATAFAIDVTYFEH